MSIDIVKNQLKTREHSSIRNDMMRNDGIMTRKSIGNDIMTKINL